MKQEAYEEDAYEKRMRSDEDYAIEQFTTEIEDAQRLLRDVVTKLESYGHTHITIEHLAGL